MDRHTPSAVNPAEGDSGVSIHLDAIPHVIQGTRPQHRQGHGPCGQIGRIVVCRDPVAKEAGTKHLETMHRGLATATSAHRAAPVDHREAAAQRQLKIHRRLDELLRGLPIFGPRTGQHTQRAEIPSREQPGGQDHAGSFIGSTRPCSPPRSRSRSRPRCWRRTPAGNVQQDMGVRDRPVIQQSRTVPHQLHQRTGQVAPQRQRKIEGKDERQDRYAVDHRFPDRRPHQHHADAQDIGSRMVQTKPR